MENLIQEVSVCLNSLYLLFNNLSGEEKKAAYFEYLNLKNIFDKLIATTFDENTPYYNEALEGVKGAKKALDEAIKDINNLTDSLNKLKDAISSLTKLLGEASLIFPV